VKPSESVGDPLTSHSRFGSVIWPLWIAVWCNLQSNIRLPSNG